MSLDDLWNLHKRVVSILEERLDHERRKLERQLKELSRKFGGARSDTRERRPYPKVEPKFRNPADPTETWAGRGKQPRWVRELLAAGRSLDDLKI